ncbi:MAG TPA: CRISPR-associated helicase Cas3' [Fervidobacterium sp.]|nr:CRISPR-associated helicase Cas3' [Fervidobacterium sp.]
MIPSFSFLDGKKSHPEKLLKDHLEGVWHKAEEIAMYHGYDELIESLKNICVTHDLAKAHERFQKHLVQKGIKYAHAEPSSIITFMMSKDVFQAELVRRHHSYLEDFEQIAVFWRELDYTDAIKQVSEFAGKEGSFYIDEKQWHSSLRILRQIEADETNFDSLWLRLRLLYSILITADRLDSIGVDDINFENIQYDEEKFERYIETLPKDELTSWRTEIRTETIENVDKIEGPGVYTISLPTGAGKTLIGLQSAMKLASKFSLKTIVYVLPFISIVDQNTDVAKNVCDKVQEDHHLVSMERETEDLTTLERFVISFRYFKDPLIVTTLAKFWEVLYSPAANDSMSFHRLKDAVVILDEPQSIPAKYWQGFGETLKFLSEKLGTHFILMTATQPMIAKGEELAPKVSFPRNRHEYNVSNEKITLDDMKVIIDENASYHNRSSLVILNTRKEALESFVLLKKILGENLLFLSAWVIPEERMKRIKKLKELEKLGMRRNLVSTQVIEAGVDLDFDYVFRDIAPFDSIVQAAGRCNRRMMNEVGRIDIAEIVREDNPSGRSYASDVYDDISLDVTKEILMQRKRFFETDVQEMLSKYYDQLGKKKYQEGPWYNICKGQWSKFNPLISEIPYEDTVLVDTDGTVSEQLYKLESMENTLENLDAKRNVWKKIQKYAITVPRREMQEWENAVNEVFLDQEKKIEFKGNGIWLISKSAIGEIYSTEVGFIPYNMREEVLGSSYG